MKKTKVLFALWAILVIIIMVLLTVMGFVLKNRSEKYGELESKLLDSATEFALDRVLFDSDDAEFIVTSEELIKLGYLDSLEMEEDSCSGYVVIKNNGAYQYESYITCDNYTTHNYTEKK